MSDYARKALTGLGVEVRIGQAVSECTAKGVTIGSERLPAKTVIWAAGVAASPAAQWLDTPADRAGRILVTSNLTVPGHPDIFVIGDAAHVEMPNGKMVPGIAPAAKQEGAYVAETIKARVRGGETSCPPFHYKDAGSLATIGKRAAVVDWLAELFARDEFVLSRGAGFPAGCKPGLFPAMPAPIPPNADQLASGTGA